MKLKVHLYQKHLQNALSQNLLSSYMGIRFSKGELLWTHDVIWILRFDSAFPYRKLTNI